MRTTILLSIFIINFSLAQTIDTLKTVDIHENVTNVQYKDNGALRNYIIHYEYDKQHRVIKEYATDTLGNILPRIGLAPILVYEYKLIDGNRTKIEYCYDKSMNPDVLDTYPFYHKLISTYNSKNKIIERWGFSLNGSTLFRIGYLYNNYGLESQIKYLDNKGNNEKGKPSIIEYKYDNKKRLISEENYDYLYKPYSSKNTYFKKEISYKNEIEYIKYYDKNLEIWSEPLYNSKLNNNENKTNSLDKNSKVKKFDYKWDIEITESNLNEITVIVKCKFEESEPILAYIEDSESKGIPGIIFYGAKGFSSYPKKWDEIIPHVKPADKDYPLYYDSLALKIVFIIDTSEKSSAFHIQFNALGVDSNNELYRIDEADACFYYLRDKKGSKPTIFVGGDAFECKRRFNF
jgi:hypothetical protein